MSDKTDDNFLHHVFEDVGRATDLLELDDSQFNRRVLVRTIYSTLEAFVHWLKARAVAACRNGTLHCSHTEMGILLEETSGIDAKGRAFSRPIFIPLDQNFRFVCGLYLHREFLPLDVDFGSHGWADLKAGIRVRNRLTHPKCAADFFVSDGEFHSVKSGHAFVMATVCLHFAKAIENLEKLKKKIAILEDQLASISISRTQEGSETLDALSFDRGASRIDALRLELGTVRSVPPAKS